MKHKKTIIFLLIIYLILLSLSAAGYFISNSSKYIFSHSIERTSKNLLPNIKKSINLVKTIHLIIKPILMVMFIMKKINII